MRHLALARVVLVGTVRRYLDAEGPGLAAGLAYSSLLSFVPLVASVTLLIATIFSDAQASVYALIHKLIPGASRQVVADLEIAAAQAHALSRWATVVFAFTSLRTFLLVEDAANALWGTAVPRPFLKRVGIAVVVVFLGPVAMGVAASILLKIRVSVFSIHLTDTAVTACVLTLLYWAVPTSHVRWGPAFAAGLLAAVGFALVRWAFRAGVVAVTDISHVYGSITAIVIFVLAVGFAWDILVFGMAFAHAVQFREELLAHDEPARQTRLPGPLEEAVRLLVILGQAWDAGHRSATLGDLADAVRQPPDEVRSRLERLAEAGLVREADDGVFVLTRPPEGISLYTVARAVGEAEPRAVPSGEHSVAGTLRRVYTRADREERGVLQGTSLRDLAEQAGAKAKEAPSSAEQDKNSGEKPAEG